MKKGALEHLGNWEKLSLVIATCILSSMLFSILGSYFAEILFGVDTFSPDELTDLTRIESIRSIKLINFFFQVGAFLLPSFILARLFSTDSNQYLLGLTKLPKVSNMVFLLIMFPTMVVINNWLTEINNNIDFSFLSEELMNKILYEEALIKKSIYAYIGLSWKSYFLNLLLLAIIPAIGEELIFRGILQNLLVKLTKKIHFGVWVTAFLFAFIHFQFLDFLPRLALGIGFGYIVIITGNIWYTVFLHFLNNATALSLEFFSRKGYINLSNNLFSFGAIHVIFAIIICVIIVQLLRKNSSWKQVMKIYLK